MTENKIKIEKGSRLAMELWRTICEEILPDDGFMTGARRRTIAYNQAILAIEETLEQNRAEQIYDS